MTLTAPKHIRGPLPHFTPKALRDERNAWVAKAKQDGRSYDEISEALGIEKSNVIRAAKVGGFKPKERMTRRYSVVTRAGVKLGSIGDLFAGMDAKHQDALINAAMKQNATIAEVLAKTFVEGRR